MNILQIFSKKIIQISLIAVSILGGGVLHAQEFNFTVKVTAPRLVSADIKTIQSLEASVREFYNNTKWTDDAFENDERIEGNIQIIIKADDAGNRFKAQIAISVSRPIFGTSEKTPIFTHLDDEVGFAYEPYQPIQYAKNAFADNLTSTLSYYAFCILGADYDSFSPLGGETFWQTAQEVRNIVPDALQKEEWTGITKRGAVVETVLNPRFKAFRQAMYDYHRVGLDNANTDVEKCRATLTRSIERVAEANDLLRNAYIIRIFANTKMNEIIEIFKNGTPTQRAKVVEAMTKIDPANANRLKQLESN